MHIKIKSITSVTTFIVDANFLVTCLKLLIKSPAAEGIYIPDPCEPRPLKVKTVEKNSVTAGGKRALPRNILNAIAP
jgi:hypothetical protein